MNTTINIRHLIAVVVAALLVFIACKKVPVGYISSQVRYVSDTIRVPKGTNFSTDARGFEVDGSSYPISVKLLEVRDLATGKPVSFFTDKHDVTVFTALFDPNTDTTVELLNKKRKTESLAPVKMIEKSGQLMFNTGTIDIPNGNYTFDIQLNNGSGQRIFKDISTIQIQDIPFKVENSGGTAWFQDNSTISGDIGVPTITFKKLNNDGYQVRLKITDKTGTPFNPKAGELIKRGDRPTFETYAKFHPVQYTDTTMVCDFELTPFPMLEFPGYGYLMYYRIPSKFVTIDPGITTTPASIYSVNPRFAIRVLQTGTYEVTVKIPYVTRKGG
ncbi:DUF5007 domain-containing protein [Pseudoflavitalea sp. G-6-1-2]|uniref:DUF5007 domain-containing protein n=1 Tax=Pseudoflavitalea sp. G-6-1-2 TaxID=2728841 RepID=UPI00146A4EB0|nr:DUF5007 domain-containing protein [Pseudoflavitalea sp. G-6-1-2]NML21987.1 DUF5007 domain-containing protein [Pseudoflavitalea sp. G-6-1-2]